MSNAKEFSLILGMFALIGAMFILMGYLLNLADRGMFQITFSDGHKLVCRYASPTSCGMLYDNCDDHMIHRCTVNSFYEEIK